MQLDLPAPATPPVRQPATPGTDDAAVDLPGPVLFVTDELVVGLHGVAIAGDVLRLLPITPGTQALVEERSGAVLMWVVGWALSLAGAALAWLGRGSPLGLGAGMAAMLAGSWLVHRHIEGCSTHLVLRDGDRVCELACRVRRLGEDADALHQAQRALQHAATLCDERLARQQLAAAQHHSAWPAAKIHALLQTPPDLPADLPAGGRAGGRPLR